MKIKEFEVAGLFGREKPILVKLHDDLNIFTGRNGAGKTSLLKLLWYIISGNLLVALNEIEFKSATIITDEYRCTVHRLNRFTCRVELDIDGEQLVFEDAEEFDDGINSAEDQANPRLMGVGSSVFLPTFRRIEGGFTLNTFRYSPSSARQTRKGSDVEEALVALSRKLTNENHLFVAAISTIDITGILLRQYADLSEQNDALHQRTSQGIIEKIKAFKSEAEEDSLSRSKGTQLDSATSLIDEIRATIEKMEQQRVATMAPISAVSALVGKLFRASGIKFGARLSFGDAASAISSDLLSAGEKQMLSFICYNAFYKDSVIFIDEPELSLHVDWQRQLFAILQNQYTSNQFIVATHSPFIYGKYPEKEVTISTDRGDSGV